MLKVTRIVENSGEADYFVHHHIEFEINLFLSGSGTYLISGEEHLIRAGDIFFFGNDEIHMVSYVDPSQPMEILKMHFEPRFIWGDNSHILDSRYMQIFYDKSKGFVNKLSSELDITKQIRENILEIEGEYIQKKNQYLMFIKTHLLNIFLIIIRHFNFFDSKNANDNIYQHSRYPDIQKVLSYIDANFMTDISNKELAKLANMSQNHFLNIFKKLNNLTPYNYIIRKRIEYALKLLDETDMSVLDIAYACGFNNTASFYSLFKKYIGKSPSEVRKLN